MKNSSYYKICEELWNNWKEDSGFIKNEISEKFFNHIDKGVHCPEPYLSFENTDQSGESENRVFFLTVNPGCGDKSQEKDTIASNNSIIKFENDYLSNSIELGRYYKDPNGILDKGSLNRIKAMDKIAKKLNCNKFIQLESFPFHSVDLPDDYKSEIIKLSKIEGSFVNKYVKSLREYCIDKNVIVICVAQKQAKEELNEWIKFQCEIIGLSLENSISYPLKYSDKGNLSVSCLVDTSKGKIKMASLFSGRFIIPAKKIIDLLDEIQL